MPTPTAPGVVRAQATFQGRSGLPEDRFVTTFHFRTPSGTAEALHHAEAAEKVREFWLDPTSTDGGVSMSMSQYLSGAVYRGVAGLVIRTYHLGDPEPREPVITEHATTGTPPSVSYPAEVAICLSFSGDRALPRQRGRVYIGPLGTGVSDTEGATGRVKVGATFRTHATRAAARMAGGSESDPARWVVYSPTSNTSTIITKGYVDDGFDTQRRRGEAPVDRTVFLASE